MLNFLIGVALCIYIWQASAEWRSTRRYKKRMHALERMWRARESAENARKLGLFTNYQRRRPHILLWALGTALVIIGLIGVFQGSPQPQPQGQHQMVPSESLQPQVPQEELSRRPS